MTMHPERDPDMQKYIQEIDKPSIKHMAEVSFALAKRFQLFYELKKFPELLQLRNFMYAFAGRIEYLYDHFDYMNSGNKAFLYEIIMDERMYLHIEIERVAAKHKLEF